MPSFSRRHFLDRLRSFGSIAVITRAVAAGALSAAVVAAPVHADDTALAQKSGEKGKAATPLKILVLGGTAFLGPEVVEAALERGHTVTLFNRGRTRADLFPDLEKLRGNRDPKRDEGLTALEGDRTWDVVIDNSGYYPRHVTASAELLAPRVKQYIYISSVSAFKEGAPPSSDESFGVAELEDPTVETMGEGFRNYGGLKAACEAAAEAAMPGRVTNIRPGFIVGPGDRTGRFNYWPLRAREGGEMLGPGSPSDPVQWIDVRDLAEWMIHCAEQGTTGVFLATGPVPGGTIGEIIDTSIAVAKRRAAAKDPVETVDTTVTWVPTEFLREQGVSPGSDLPIWIPAEGNYAGFHRWNNAKAVAAGLTFRPLDDTIDALLTWYDAQNSDDQKRFRAGMNRDRETAVLKAFHEAGAPDSKEGATRESSSDE